VDDRLQLARCDSSHQLPQDPAHPLRVGLLEHIQLKDVIPDVGAHGGHFVLTQDVAACHFDEPATVLQAGQTGVDEAFARQAVEHHVHTRAVACLHDFGGEGGCAAVEDVLHAQGSEIGLFRRAGRGEDLGARRLHELDGCQTDPARARVAQHARAGLESGQLKGQCGRHESARYRRESRHRDARGCVCHQFLVRDHPGPEGAEPQPDHLIADRDGGDLGPDVEDVAAHLPSQESLLDEAERPEDVPEVQPGGRDRDPNLPGLQGTRRQRLDIRSIEDPGRIRRQNPLRIVGQGQPLRPFASTHKAGDLTASRAEDDMILAVRVHQFVGEIGCGGAQAGIQIDHSGLQMRGFAGHRLAKAPQRRSTQLPAALSLQHLRPLRYKPHALLGCRVGVANALHHGQRACAHPRDVFADLVGRRPRMVSVQRQDMNDATQRDVVRESLDQRLP